MRRRWSDNDRNFGPFTIAIGGSYRPIALVLNSGESEYPGCSLRMSAFGLTMICALPPIIKPWGERWGDCGREYGFSVSEGFLNLYFGRQTHDSRTEQRWGYFLPWTQWRHVRTSLYGLTGEHVWTEPKTEWRLLTAEQNMETHRAIWEAEAKCPTRTFPFKDFDGELLTAKTRIEEREWRFGTGWFKWLSLFRKPKIRRSLNIEFSGGTGKRKGSWKGGTIGHSIDMLPGELHEAAFRRYCLEHDMTFISKEATA